MTSRRTFVERLDPRTKLIGVFLLAIIILSSRSARSLFGPTLFLAIGCIASPLTLRFLARRFVSVTWFLVFIVLMNIFSTSGDVLFELFGLFATREGLTTGSILAAKIVLLLIASLLFVQTTTVSDVVDALETLLHPFRKRLGSIIQVISISLNFVPMLVQTAQRIKRAQIARGADISNRLSHQVRFALSAMLPLFALAFASSEHLALAMEARCYDPALERTHFSTLVMHLRDYLILLVLLSLVTINFLPVHE